MDRNGDQWTGDDIDAEARGEDAGGAANRSGLEDRAPRQRAVDTAAEDAVQINDDGDAPVTTAGSGAAGESD